MEDILRHGGAPTRALAVPDIARIAEASWNSDEAPALLVRLATLIPCEASAIAAAPIELIDRDAGLLRVPAPAGGFVDVALSSYAAFAVETARDGRLKGPLVADVHGQAVIADRCTEEYAKELLVAGDGLPLDVEWTFRSLRASIFDEMTDHGVPLHVATTQAGLGIGHLVGEALLRILQDQRAAAEWWPYRLAMRPAAAFAVARVLAVRAKAEAYSNGPEHNEGGGA